MLQLPFWAHNLIYWIKFSWGFVGSSLYKKWQSNARIHKIVNNVWYIYSYMYMNICIHIWEKYLSISMVFILKNKVKASFSSKWHKEHVQKTWSFPKLYSCVPLKKHLNVYSKCEMEESKATITLRFTAFMESNI